MNKIALITGATSGIGKATALILAENGYDLILTGRRAGRLQEVKKEIQEQNKTEILVLNFDIRNRDEVEMHINGIDEKWKAIDVLVNNAGLAAGFSTIHDGTVDDWERMIDTNVKGLLYVSKTIGAMMVARKAGHIVNIGSIAGKEVYPNGNVYCATKHAVEAITKGLRIDMVQHGIKVTNIAPGMVETEFSIVRFKGDKTAADKVYENIIPLYAKDIAEAILFAVSRPPHVNINDMLIMPTAQASAFVTHRNG